MKLQIVQIGNSTGIRIPKTLLKRCGITDKVTAKVQDGNLILSPVHEPRAGWEESFKKMAQKGDDKLLDQDRSGSAFDKKNWQW